MRELRALLWRLFTVAEDASTDLIREAMIGRERPRTTPLQPADGPPNAS
jgi:hypothetical protein